MLTSLTLMALAALSSATFKMPSLPSQSQSYVHVPSSCDSTYLPGRDEMIYTVAYPYASVIPIIFNFGDLTWSGNPPWTITLNGTTNTPHTSRSYSLQNTPTTETLMTYSNPPFGPYDEVHNTALVQFGDTAAYITYDGTRVTPVCNGLAAQFNMTAVFCSNMPEKAEGLLHSLHMGDAQNVGRMLGGQNFRNFTSCADL